LNAPADERSIWISIAKLLAGRDPPSAPSDEPRLPSIGTPGAVRFAALHLIRSPEDSTFINA
jgi:hypothetical protein